MTDFPGRLFHETPGWVKAGAVFHIRVRVANSQRQLLTDAPLAAELLAAARRYHDLGKWSCHMFLLMPDHWHALVVFPYERNLTATVRDWKRGVARFQGVHWQENFFDHRIRSRKEGDEKWHYISRNPVVKGLCEQEDCWPWWWSGLLAK